MDDAYTFVCKMKHPALLSALLFSALSAHAANGADAVSVHGWQNFWFAANYGELGVFQTSGASSSQVIWLLKPEVPFAMSSSSGQISLALNHLDKSATTEDMTTTYVGMSIFVVHDRSRMNRPASLFVYRNSGWSRDWCRRCFGPADRAQKVFQEPGILQRAFDARQGSDEDQLDTVFDPVDFDGQIDGVPDSDSWDEREGLWNTPQREEAECTSSNRICDVRNVLLKFTPSAGRRNMSALVYGGINVSQGDSVDVYVYSPTEIDFNAHYRINVQ